MHVRSRNTAVNKALKWLRAIGLPFVAILSVVTLASAESDAPRKMFIPVALNAPSGFTDSEITDPVVLKANFRNFDNQVWNQIVQTFAAQDMLVTREANTVSFSDQHNGGTHNVLRLECIGCDSATGKPRVSNEVTAAEMQQPQDLKLVLVLDSERTLEVQPKSRSRVILTFLRDARSIHSLDLACRQCEIEVIVDQVYTPPATTETPVPPTPTPTNTPVSPPSTPPTGDWLCPTHDPNAWHPHYDAARNCWYDHVHGADPNAIAYRLGAPWAFLANYAGYDASNPAWQWGTISYPWQTNNENAYKHGGYKWQAFDTASTVPAGVLKVARRFGEFNWITDGPFYGEIVAGRYQEHFAAAHQHGDMLMFDALVRFHSFWAEFATSNGGIIRGGGHWDTGRFWAYHQEIVPLPGQDPNPMSPRHEFPLADPYRAEGDVCETWINNHAPSSTALWTSRPTWDPREGFASYDYGYNAHLGLFSVHKDVSACVNRDGTATVHCPDGQCKYNNTEYGPFRVWAYVAPTLDGSTYDRDTRSGWVTAYLFTDRKGNVASSCTEPGPNCVPYVVENVQPGWYQWETSFDGQHEVTSMDFDQSPRGKYYINVLGN